MITNLICISCPKGCNLTIDDSEGSELKVTGYNCKRGLKYAISEMTHPERVLTTTLPIESGGVAAVRTASPIPKKLLREAMELLKNVTVPKDAKFGDVVVPDLLHTGIGVMITRI